MLSLLFVLHYSVSVLYLFPLRFDFCFFCFLCLGPFDHLIHSWDIEQSFIPPCFWDSITLHAKDIFLYHFLSHFQSTWLLSHVLHYSMLYFDLICIAMKRPITFSASTITRSVESDDSNSLSFPFVCLLPFASWLSFHLYVCT